MPILQLLVTTWETLTATVMQLKLSLLTTELLSSAFAIHQNNPVKINPFTKLFTSSTECTQCT